MGKASEMSRLANAANVGRSSVAGREGRGFKHSSHLAFENPYPRFSAPTRRHVIHN